MKQVLIIISIFFSLAASAQQVPMYSQFLFHDYLINPAIVGTRDYYDAKLTNRLQWVGVEDAPRTTALSVNGPLKNRKMGLGGYFLNDVAGHIYQRGGYLSYSYIVGMSNGAHLSFGVSAGLKGYTLDGTKLNLQQTGDQVLSSGIQSAYVPDGAFGMYLYSKRLTFGFSVLQLFNSKLKFFDNGNVGSVTLKQHYQIHGSYRFGADEADFSFMPYLLIKYVDPVPAQFDVGMKVTYKNNVWLGAAYRSDDALSGMLGFTVRDNLTIGYSYDFITSDISKRASASHEILLGLKLQRALPSKK